MIAAIEWVPQGVAKKVPLKYDLTAAIPPEEEQEAIAQSSKKKGKIQLPKVDKSNQLPADLRMDEYSDDEDDGAAIGNLLVGADGELEEDDDEEEAMEEAPAQEQPEEQDSSSDDDDADDNLDDVPDTREYTPIDVSGLQAMGFGEDALTGIEGETYQDDESDAEDVMINSDDAVIVVAKTEEDFSSLEVHIYDTKQGNMFIHHDIPLPSFPLCLAHGQTIGLAGDAADTDTDTSNPGGGGNFCAVGTFDPGIEIWNLDIVNVLEPSCVLGGMMAKGNALKPGSHTGAVMGLSWNQVHRHVIASGSADHTVKLWDVSLASNNSDEDSANANAGTFSHHTDKVQSVVWHPVEATILATGSYDRTVALVDARDAAGKNIKKVRIPADCEALAWDPFHPECLTAACEDGSILTWDVRNFVDKKPLWSFVANEFGGINDISYNRHVPGLMAAASTDKTVSLWDVYNQEGVPLQNNTNPRACARKDMKVGKLYTVSFYPSSPWLLSCGGSENQLALWDMSSEDTLWHQFAKRAESLAEYENASGATDGDGGLFDTPTSGDDNNNGEKGSNNSKSKKKKKGKKKKVHKAR